MYAEQETDELIAMLRETESLDEQGDILQYLVDTHGLEFNTGKLFFIKSQLLSVNKTSIFTKWVRVVLAIYTFRLVF